MPTSASGCYLDSSALVKLAVVETESAALRRFLSERPARFSSAVATVEVIRAVRPKGPAALQRARAVLDAVDLLALDEELLGRAAMLDPAELRSLDAIHLASAQELGSPEIVAYDRRLAEAARALGLSVTAPR